MSFTLIYAERVACSTWNRIQNYFDRTELCIQKCCFFVTVCGWGNPCSGLFTGKCNAVQAQRKASGELYPAKRVVNYNDWATYRYVFFSAGNQAVNITHAIVFSLGCVQNFEADSRT